MENAHEEMTVITEEPIEPELTLPKWIKPDPEAGDKGKLLYIEEWARKHRYHVEINKMHIINHMVYIGFYSIIFLSSSSVLEWILLVMILALALVLNYLNLGSDMPFCVYERGLTYPTHAFMRIMQRNERFIPWEEIKNIGFLTCNDNTRITGPLRVILDNGEKIILHDKMIHDPIRFLKLIDSVVKEKIDKTAFQYFRDEDSAGIIRPKRSDYRSESSGGTSVQVCIILFSFEFSLSYTIYLPV